jgi:UDP-glucose 4-epimerase
VAEGRRVLITGISDKLAGMVAAALEKEDEVSYIVGVDSDDPVHDLTRTEFVRTDVTNPLMAKVLAATDVDTLVHMSTVSAPTSVGGRTRMKERNVMGAIQLMASAHRASNISRVVVKSSTAIYGSEYTHPSLISEDFSAPAATSKDGYSKDVDEVEGAFRAFVRRRPEVALTTLRYANFVGGSLDSTFARYFSLPAVPTIFGHDPRLQFCHEEDAVEVMVRAVLDDHPGTWNVAGPGVVYLSQAIRLAGRVPAPVAAGFVRSVSGAIRRTRRMDFTPEQLRYLKYGRVADISALRFKFGYQPKWSSRAAFEDFVARRRISGLVNRDEVIRWERELYDFIQRKGQERWTAARRR